MTGRSTLWLRALEPWVWAGLAIGLILAVGVLSDPFGWRGRQREQARKVAAVGELEARYRHQEKMAQQWLA